MDTHGVDGGIIFTVTEVLKAIVAGLAGVAVWLLKKLGDRHIESIDNLSEKFEALIERVDKLSERVTVIEVKETFKGHQ